MRRTQLPAMFLAILMTLGGVWWIGPIAMLPRLAPGIRSASLSTRKNSDETRRFSDTTVRQALPPFLQDALNENPAMAFATPDSLRFSAPIPRLGRMPSPNTHGAPSQVAARVRRNSRSGKPDAQITTSHARTTDSIPRARAPARGQTSSGGSPHPAGSNATSAKPFPVMSHHPSISGTPEIGRTRAPTTAASTGAPHTVPAVTNTSLDASEGADIFGRYDAVRFEAPHRWALPNGPRRPPGPKIRPLLLYRFLGLRALHPPPMLEPPTALLSLDLRRPLHTPTGSSDLSQPAELSDFESIDPTKVSSDRRNEPHWDAEQWHDGNARGMMMSGRWAWLYRDSLRWWGISGSGNAPLLYHQGAWWTNEMGTWFIVHDGRPWAWREFREWGGSGLYNPASGIEMVYSRDLQRVAIISPGQGATVYDAVSGLEIVRIPEADMPPRRHPRPGLLRNPTRSIFASP